MRVLLAGWPSFLHGEATAGDVLSMEAVGRTLAGAGIDYDMAWSPVFRPQALHLDTVDPDRYTCLVFACGPLHGEQVRELHQRFVRCHRVAVGVSVIDPDDPAVTGFHTVLARDGTESVPRRDLASGPRPASVPLVGLTLSLGQGEYGRRRRHEDVADRLRDWLGRHDCARLALDTRLDSRSWGYCATPAQLESLVRRLDLVVTTRLHGLVLALKNGIPALAVDPVAGGAKVTAQTRAWCWPAVIPAEDLLSESGKPQGHSPRTGPEPADPAASAPGEALLARWWHWCLSEAGNAAARAHATTSHHRDEPLLDELLQVLGERAS